MSYNNVNGALLRLMNESESEIGSCFAQHIFTSIPTIHGYCKQQKITKPLNSQHAAYICYRITFELKKKKNPTATKKRNKNSFLSKQNHSVVLPNWRFSHLFFCVFLKWSFRSFLSFLCLRSYNQKKRDFK